MSFFVNVRWGILAFFSGVAALIYQTLWVKQLSLVVGVDVYAVATGVAAFCRTGGRNGLAGSDNHPLSFP
jgi:hypothetical protein